MTILHEPENTFVIEKLWAFVSRDEKGNEGLVAAPLSGMMMPMIAADKDRLESLKPIAKDIAKMTKQKIVLLEFSTKKEVEVIDGID